MSPLFISFEGIDGCGKSTQLQLLKGHLEAAGHELILPREPGGTEIGEAIRSILLNKENSAMTARTELLLFLASRAQICQDVIRPALKAGKIVLCDRFMDSSVAYQGYGRGLGADTVHMLNRFAVQETVPDLTILMDLPVEDAVARIRARGEEKENRLDVESIEFMQRTREGFLALAEAERERIRVVDARASIPEIEKAILDIVRRTLK